MLTKEQFDALPKDQQDKIAAAIEEIQKKTADPNPKGLPQMTAEEFAAVIEGAMDKKLKSMTPTDHKYFAFPGIDPEKFKKLLSDTTLEGKMQKTKMFFNALLAKDVKVLNEMDKEVRTKAAYGNETTGAEGAFLVPEEFSAEVFRLVPEYGVASRECRRIPMISDTWNGPANAGMASAHWTNEASQIYGTFPALSQIILNIKKLATLPKVTSELLKDANIDVMQYLAMEIAMAFAKAEDIQAFTGIGSPFVGAINATGIGTYIHGGTGIQALSYSDLALIPDNLYGMAQAGAKWYFHRTIRGHIRSLVTTAGAPLFPGSTVINEIMGYPVQPVEVLPGISHAAAHTDSTTYAIFGNFRMGMLMGVRGGLEMKLLTEGTVGADNLGEKDMMAIRVIERLCFGVCLPSAFISISC